MSLPGPIAKITSTIIDKYITCLFIFSIINILMPSSAAISISFQSGGGNSQVGLSESYSLDSSTLLSERVTLHSGLIDSSRSIEGLGTNKIAQNMANSRSSLTSNVASVGNLAADTTSFASSDIIGSSQSITSSGIAQADISGSAGSKNVQQVSGVAFGDMISTQTATAQGYDIGVFQTSSIAGAQGFMKSEASSSDNSVKITGGLNDIGAISGQMIATTSEGAKSIGDIKALSPESKAYSAASATSTEADVYSYTSSSNSLATNIGASANGHVASQQDIKTGGDGLAYASTLGDSGSKTYSADMSKATGTISASAGSPQIIDTNLAGNIQETNSNLAPAPGSWIWTGLGGKITSTPSQVKDDQGRIHAFARGDDGGLWDNIEGDWRGMGGEITSDPSALKDAQGRIHVLARGGDGSVLDSILNTGTLSNSWLGLGGSTVSNPHAALSPDGSSLKIVAKGADSSVWMKDLSTSTLSGTWSTLGGYITADPNAIYDAQGKLHVLARGGDNSLLDNVNGNWQSLGGDITSEGKPVVNPFNPEYLYTYARGEDGTLWRNALNTATGISNWQALGGSIDSGSASVSDTTVYKGNPAPVVDTNGAIHTFIRGSDGNLQEYVNGNWYNLGMGISSDPSAIRDKNGKLRVAAMGIDNALYAATTGTKSALYDSAKGTFSTLYDPTISTADLPATSIVGPVASDYTSIQLAVDAAPSGGVVKITSGTYPENVGIRKKITLEGVDTGAGKPVVDANSMGNAVTIYSNGQAAISGLNVINANNDPMGSIRAGIYVYSNNNVLKDNDIIDNFYGAYLFHSDNNEITGNNIQDNIGMGLQLEYSSGNIIKSNSVTGNGYDGVFIEGSNENSFEGNDISSNDDGLLLISSSSNIFKNNKVNYNGMNGFSIFNSFDNTITGNTIEHNDEAGISLWEKSAGNTASSNTICYNAVGIASSSSNGNTFTGNTVEGNNGNGIQILGSNANAVSGNIVANNSDSGIDISYSNDNVVSDNSVDSNTKSGIELSDNSAGNMVSGNALTNNTAGLGLNNYANSNVISDNTVTNNNGNGIEFNNGNGNTIIGNTISINSGSGIALSGSNSNRFYLNNVISNNGQVLFQSSSNYWDSLTQLTYKYNGNTFTNYMGNFWDDNHWPDINADGIIDVLYPNPGRYQTDPTDYYPLTSQSGNYQIEDQGPIPIYRMWSPSQADHFYTTSYDEYSTTAVNYGYKQEGALGYLFTSPIFGTTPLYRMWSPSQTDHFYTTRYDEYSTTAVNYGYKQEGILGYVYSSPQTGTTPIYRMWNPAQADHFYTTSYDEYSTTAVNYGYKQEGILGYESG